MNAPGLPLLLLLNFNSIKVRLERAGEKRLAALFEFQFHKGTIRTTIYERIELEHVISIP